MKKTIILFSIGLMAICLLQSCDSGHRDEMYLFNKTNNTVLCIDISDTTNRFTLAPDEETLFFQSSGVGPSLFDYQDEMFYFSPVRIVFNDSICVSYDVENTLLFEKNILSRESWEIVEHKNLYRKAVYTIDEQDYHNALVQCGYEQQTD